MTTVEKPRESQTPLNITERDAEMAKVTEQLRKDLGPLAGLYESFMKVTDWAKNMLGSLSGMLGVKLAPQETKSVSTLEADMKKAPGKGFTGPVSISRSSSLYKEAQAAAKDKATFEANFKKIEDGLNAVAKKLDISAPALFAVVQSESRFQPNIVEASGGGGKGLIQFTGGTQKLLGGKWDIDSQIRGIEAYYSQNKAALTAMQSAQDLKILTRWGMFANLSEAHKANEAPDNGHFQAAWDKVRASLA